MCKLFNHSSEFCKLKPVSVKSSGSHKANECKITDRKNIKCAKFGGNPSANFRMLS